MSDTIRDELARKLPRSVERYTRSRPTAIRLFCIECMGGSAIDAGTCAERSCFLWPHGPAGRKERKALRLVGDR